MGCRYQICHFSNDVSLILSVKDHPSSLLTSDFYWEWSLESQVRPGAGASLSGFRKASARGSLWEGRLFTTPQWWWTGGRHCVSYPWWLCHGVSSTPLGGHWKLIHGFPQNLQYIYNFLEWDCKDYGDSKRIKNLCNVEILTEYVGLANYLEMLWE